MASRADAPSVAVGPQWTLVAAAGGLAIGRAVGDDESQSISAAEHSRLLSGCIRESDEPAACAPWVADVVDETVDEGCGDHEAAQVIAAWFDVGFSSERQFRRDRTEIYARCYEDER